MNDLDEHGRPEPAGAWTSWPAAPGPTAGAASLRWIVCHMIEEYARRNGHADLIRESVDGLTGE
jgi:uncharacterized protein DUF664